MSAVSEEAADEDQQFETRADGDESDRGNWWGRRRRATSGCSCSPGGHICWRYLSRAGSLAAPVKVSADVRDPGPVSATLGEFKCSDQVLSCLVDRADAECDLAQDMGDEAVWDSEACAGNLVAEGQQAG